MTLNLDAAGIIRQGHALGLDIAVSCGLDDQQQIAVCLDLMAEHELSPQQPGHLCRVTGLMWPDSVRLVPLFAYRCRYRQLEKPSQNHPFGRVKYEESPKGSCGYVEYSERRTGRLRRCSCNIGRGWDDGLYRDDKAQRWALRDNVKLAYPSWYKPSRRRERANKHVLNGYHPLGAKLGPEGETCKTCAYRFNDMVESWCYRFGGSTAILGSRRTRVIQRWRACERWEQRTPLQGHEGLEDLEDLPYEAGHAQFDPITGNYTT